MRYLTKSRFKLAVECPTKLFYTGKPKIYRDTKQADSFLQMLVEGATKWASWPSADSLKGLRLKRPTIKALWRRRRGCCNKIGRWCLRPPLPFAAP